MAAFPPSLHGRVVPMPKGASDRADSASLPDKLCMIHTQDVHVPRTPVNVESVCWFGDTAYVPNDQTTGETLSRLRVRSGLSVRDFAVLAGFSHGSGVQRYIDPAFEKLLPVDKAKTFAAVLAGRGSPPIERSEIFELAGLPAEPNAKPFQMEGASDERMVRNVPVYGTALGADEIVDGEAIEQTTLNTSEVIAWLRRPVLLDGRADVYGLYVQGSSMSPRYRDGATVFVERRKTPKIGDDAVIYLRMPDDDDGERASCVLIKTLVKKTSAYIELEQYNPALTFRIPMDRVAQMDRVITLDELVA